MVIMEASHSVAIHLISRSGLRHRPAGWSTSRAALPLVQLYISVAGTIDVRQRGQCVRVTPGQVLALAPLLPWHIHCPQAASYLHLRVVAHGAAGHDVLPWAQLPLYADLGPMSRALLPHAASLFTAWDRGDQMAGLRLQGMISFLLADLQTQMSESEQAPQHWLAPALAVMTLRLDDPDLRVEDLAAACDCSADWFTRRCRATLGITPKRLLQQRRIERACVLLGSQPGWSVAAVARACGFRHAHHFTAAFARACGLPPGRWRTQEKGQPHDGKRRRAATDE
ncbi:MAG: AraC family transcriptional regulator [Planctomycetota bacterium]|nr:MAG: AraC family transcriptional regulator [Planctomycetota bacterium]